MFVTNNTNVKLGISGAVVLRAREKNRFIDDEDLKLVEAVMRLKAANLVSVVKAKGLTKSVPAAAVKTVTVDTGAIGLKPRSSTERVEEVLAKEVEVKKEEEKVNEVPVQEPETVVENVQPVEEVETKEDEVVEDTNADSKKKKKSKK